MYNNMRKIQDSKITIITVVKNNSETIKKCIKSVINQNYSNIEHVIIFGILVQLFYLLV